MKVSALIFDMDGLLFDTETLFLNCAQKTGEEIGYTIPYQLCVETIGRTFEDTRRIFVENLGRDFPVDSFFSRTNVLVYDHIERHGIPIKPGAVELLHELKSRNIKTILASSSPYWMIEKNLTISGLKSYFDLIVSGEDVENGKPAPDIFLLAAKRGDVSPEECIVLEDSNNGVLSAAAAGMRTIMVPDVKPPTDEVKRVAYKTTPSLTAVRSLVLF